MRRSTIAFTSAVLLPLSLALTACGGDEDTDKDNSSDDTSQEATDDTSDEDTDESDDTDDTDDATESDDSDDSGGAAGSGDYTEPGSELALGDAADVYYDDKADLTITLTEVEEGSAADLEGVDDADGLVPFYLQFTVVGGAGAEEITYLSTAFKGLLENGEETTVSFSGSLEPCDEDMPDDFAEGVEGEFCVPAIARDGEKVVGASYQPYDSDYEDDPITWMP